MNVNFVRVGGCCCIEGKEEEEEGGGEEEEDDVGGRSAADADAVRERLKGQCTSTAAGRRRSGSGVMEKNVIA
jgi:hypothetical protein